MHTCQHRYLAAKKRCDRVFYRGGAAVGAARATYTPLVKDCYNKAETDKWACTDGALRGLTGQAAEPAPAPAPIVLTARHRGG